MCFRSLWVRCGGHVRVQIDDIGMDRERVSGARYRNAPVFPGALKLRCRYRSEAGEQGMLMCSPLESTM